jgi:hypothetical protein
MLLAGMSEYQAEPLLSTEQRNGADDAQDEQVCVACMQRWLARLLAITVGCVMSTMQCI